jgi:4-nitrophenyl phosphatase
VIDLDGVVWRSGRPIDGADRAIAELRGRGHPILFATNNSSATRATHLSRLEAVGIDAAPEELVTSAEAAAGLVRPGSSVLVLADPGVVEALEARGARVVAEGPADAVVVGFTRSLDYAGLDRASAAVREGARLIGTNTDPTFPTPEGLIPGAGALLAAVETASRTDADVAGKPHGPMADLVRARAARIAFVVGDRASTDGLLARALGAPFGLVLSGVTRPEDVPGLDPPPDRVAETLRALVASAG